MLRPSAASRLLQHGDLELLAERSGGLPIERIARQCDGTYETHGGHGIVASRADACSAVLSPDGSVAFGSAPGKRGGAVPVRRGSDLRATIRPVC